MEISVHFRTYDSYGGHVTLTLIGDYLMLGAPAFGAALDEIDVIMRFRSDEPPRKSLESMYETFHAELAELPTVTFRRKKKMAEVWFYSELLTAREVRDSRQLLLDLFCPACRQVVEHLKLLRKRFRKQDDFDFAAFQSWLDRRVEELPQTVDQLKQIHARIELLREAARQALTEWDLTGIDFDDFHPDARSVLNDPRLWDVCDEWAPHGNDTGADVLELYRDWRARHPRAAAETFFRQQMQKWNVALPPQPDDEFGALTYHQSILALAFAQLKLHATCDPAIASLAFQSLEQQPGNELTEIMTSILKQWT